MSEWRFEVWPLNAISSAADRIKSNRSNAPCVADLESMLAAFISWSETYVKWASEHRERAVKLALIGDREADREKSACRSDEDNAARCDVGIRVLRWAIAELKRGEST